MLIGILVLKNTDNIVFPSSCLVYTCLLGSLAKQVQSVSSVSISVKNVSFNYISSTYILNTTLVSSKCLINSSLVNIAYSPSLINL